MGRTRLSEDRVAHYKAKIEFLKRSIERWEKMVGDMNRPASVMMRDALQVAVDKTTEEILNIAENPKPGCVQEDRDKLCILGGSLKAYRNHLADYKDVDKKIERARSEITKYQNILKSHEENGIVNI